MPGPAKTPPGLVLPFSWVRMHGDRAYVSRHIPLSPDGKRIAYTGSDTFGDLNSDKAETDIYTIKAGEGGKTNLTNTDNVDEYMPSWGSRP